MAWPPPRTCRSPSIPATTTLDGPVATPACGRAHAIAFIGQRYDKREAWLAALGGLDVGVWGLGWARSNGVRAAGHCVHAEPAHGAAAAAIYRGTTLALNVLHADNVPAHNMRTFEIPPCGTAMLSEATRGDRVLLRAGPRVPAGRRSRALRAQAERALADRRADPGDRPGRRAGGGAAHLPGARAARSSAISVSPPG